MPRARALERGIALPPMGRSLSYGCAETYTWYPDCAPLPLQWDSVHVFLRGELKKVNRAGIKVRAEVLS